MQSHLFWCNVSHVRALFLQAFWWVAMGTALTQKYPRVSPAIRCICPWSTLTSGNCKGPTSPACRRWSAWLSWIPVGSAWNQRDGSRLLFARRESRFWSQMQQWKLKFVGRLCWVWGSLWVSYFHHTAQFEGWPELAFSSTGCSLVPKNPSFCFIPQFYRPLLQETTEVISSAQIWCSKSNESRESLLHCCCC